ncbi:MAG: phenylalanine--tRNA ligase subunit beta [Candidatus Handelsmanbacteria bacterium]|nr:phenylalanine--tRNA ligase subunit beta [Candidatus Handelsmanbacteria bacterium]
MKITYNWLKEFTEVPWDWPELIERLTMTGLEREGVEDLAGRYRGVVVGRVLERRPHPNADRLSVCQMDLGGAPQTIVCGAPNVAAGQKVAVILPGHKLPDGAEIRRSRIRGVESAGMICSQAELGLGSDADGILVLPEDLQVGAPFAAQVGLAEVVLDFGVTPNRADCLSLLGLAREVRALTGRPLRLPPHQVFESGEPTAQSTSVSIEDPQGCLRYAARVIRNVHIGPSPLWLQHRLKALGMRPINNVVDATNLVMLELGQPLHAFDLARLAESRIVVRRARPGEELETLDGGRHALDGELLVIADGEKPVALAGVMGGLHSEVRSQTTDLLIESAYFDPVRVRLGRNRLGLNTEASMRFERGADWEMAPLAADRAAFLIAQLAAGQVAPQPIDVYPAPLSCPRVPLRLERLNGLLATALDGSECRRILELLGCQVESAAGPLQVQVPSFRPDLRREVDLIEEVGRIYGYERIPPSPVAQISLTPAPSAHAQSNQWRRQLAGLGLDEVVTNTIIERKWLELAGEEGEPVILANPPTESLCTLRPTLLPSLLEAARRNFNQRAERVAIFELGKCFSRQEGRRREALCLSGLWAGRASASPWKAASRPVEFLDLKGLLEVFLEPAAPRLEALAHPLCRPGHGAAILAGDQPLGLLGQLRPAIAASFDLDLPIYIFDLNCQALAEALAPRERGFRPLPKFPPIERDLAVVLRAEAPAALVVAQARAAAPGLIEAVEVFDHYQGDQIPAGYKSLAFTVRLRSTERTLEDREATEAVEQILRRLAEAFDARLR